MRLTLSLLVGALIFMLSCKPAQQTQTSQSGKYSEDLSMLRPKADASANETGTTKEKQEPKVYVEPMYTVNKQLDAVLDSIDRINLTRKFIDGYTVMVYSGTKKEDAMNAKKQLTISIPGMDSEVQYVQPNFRVKAGKYLTRLEAEKDYEQIKRYFPAAIVVPDKIAIN